MGQWGYEGSWPEAFVVGTGVGVYKRGSKYKVKVRGVHFQSPNAEMRALLRDDRSRVPCQVRHARTLAESARNGYARANEMLSIARHIDANMDRKRIWPRRWESFREFSRDKQTSEPILIAEGKAMDAYQGKEPRKWRRKTKHRKGARHR
jgi:hypothetical protein